MKSADKGGDVMVMPMANPDNLRCSRRRNSTRPGLRTLGDAPD